MFRQPWALQSALQEADLAPHELAMWARQQGTLPEVEKLAGWLSVGQHPGYYKPLLEVAASHLRAGELVEALPVFRWAYQAWQAAPNAAPGHRYDGAKLLALWGDCFYRLQQPDEAQRRWMWALAVVPNAEMLNRLARTIEKAGAAQACQAVLAEAHRRGLPGAQALWRRWQRLVQTEQPDLSIQTDPAPVLASPDGSGVAVMADVANLDLVCGEQFGYNRRLDYGRLLKATAGCGPVRVKMAFVPDIPETLEVREHLQEAGFEIDLKQPKRSRGRIVANADTAMASWAVRWASDPQIGRIELWTGDGDFVKVREVVDQAWPQVQVAFRSFELGTAAAIQSLGADWDPIGTPYLHPIKGDQVQRTEKQVHRTSTDGACFRY